MARAIVTYGRSWQALAITRSLGRAGVEVYCGEEAPFAPCFFSKHCQGSFVHPSVSTDPAGFLDFLEEKILELKPEDPSEPFVLVPVHKETFLIARHRERFEPHIRLALTSYENIALVHDKGRLAELAMDKGVRIPETHLPRSLDEVDALAKTLDYPVFVKLREGAAGVGVKKASDASALTRIYRSFVDGHGLTPEHFPLIQGFVAGSDYCVTLLFDEGRCVAKMTYRNVRAFPRETGAGAVRESVSLPEAETAAQSLLASLGWHGIAEVDFRQEKDGPAYLIEVNPRFFGGLPQALAANVDYPHLLFRIAAGEEVPEQTEVDYSKRTESPVTGLLATLDEIAHDEALLGRMRTLRDEWGAFVNSDVRDLELRPLLDALRTATDPKDMKAFLEEKLSAHEGTVDDVLNRDDPLPALGLLYPLAVALKHGKLSTAVLTGEAEVDDRPRRRTRDYLRRPTSGAIALAGVLYALSIFLMSWEPTRSNVGWVLAWPGRLAAKVLGDVLHPSSLWGAFKLTLYHAMNFSFLYLVAAILLRESRTKHRRG